MADTSENTRRAQILEVALGLFGRRGFDGTPMSAVAAAAGMSKAGLYHHFRTKDDMLHALFGPSFDRVEALLRRSSGRRELLEGYLEIMLDDRDLATLLATDISVMTRPGIGERATELDRKLRAQMVEENAGLHEKMRAECALGVLRTAVVAFPGSDPETVREVALDGAAKVLGVR